MADADEHEQLSITLYRPILNAETTKPPVVLPNVQAIYVSAILPSQWPSVDSRSEVGGVSSGLVQPAVPWPKHVPACVDTLSGTNETGSPSTVHLSGCPPRAPSFWPTGTGTVQRPWPRSWTRWQLCCLSLEASSPRDCELKPARYTIVQ